MQPTNKSVTSREYKLILKADRFKNRVEGADAFWELVAALVKKQGGGAKKTIEEKPRRV